MKKNGYEVLWTDERKYITYTCPNKMKCRDIKLHQEKYRKEKMELEFELRRVETEKCTAESFEQRYDSEDGTSIPIFFGAMIGVQVFFQIVLILLEIYLK